MWCVWANAGVSPPQCLSQAILALNMTHIYRYWSRRYNLFTWIIYGSQHKPRNHLSELLEIHCQQAVKKNLLFYICTYFSLPPSSPSPPPNKEIKKSNNVYNYRVVFVLCTNPTAQSKVDTQASSSLSSFVTRVAICLSGVLGWIIKRLVLESSYKSVGILPGQFTPLNFDSLNQIWQQLNGFSQFH